MLLTNQSPTLAATRSRPVSRLRLCRYFLGRRPTRCRPAGCSEAASRSMRLGSSLRGFERRKERPGSAHQSALNIAALTGRPGGDDPCCPHCRSRIVKGLDAPRHNRARRTTGKRFPPARGQVSLDEREARGRHEIGDHSSLGIGRRRGHGCGCWSSAAGTSGSAGRSTARPRRSTWESWCFSTGMGRSGISAPQTDSGGLLRMHRPNLATTSPTFHRARTVLFRA